MPCMDKSQKAQDSLLEALERRFLSLAPRASDYLPDSPGEGSGHLAKCFCPWVQNIP